MPVTAVASANGATATELIGRALRRHCPVCGRGRMFDGWFAQRQRCEACGFGFERDEKEDYWLGAYFLNFMATEVLFALLLAVVLLATWPHPPWPAIIWVGAVQMIATPILSYPLAKALWLAGDLIFRPPTDADFAQRDGNV